MENAIQQRLIKLGVPKEIVEQQQPGLVAYLRQNRSKLPEIISSVLLDVEELETVFLATGTSETGDRAIYQKESFSRESVKWIQWLMFEEMPQAVLVELGKQNEGTQGVCGAVWGNNDIAYRCRTCEHDPTCAICVPCFNAGNHVSHDYSMIHTGGGCCDCGDETAWKLEGFCSNHRGPGQVQPLPAKYAISAEPVLGALLLEWKERLLAAEREANGKPKKWALQSSPEKVAHMTTVTIVDMLLSLCKCSESLLNFSATMICTLPGLLDVLLRTEQFLSKIVVTELHELLFKLLGEPNFKYEFAKAFVKHYPTLISEAIREGIDGSNSSPKFNDYPLLSNFSVQIFTVPTLTPRLVIEVNLLDMLLGNLKQLFISCAGEDGRLLASKGPIANQLYVRLVEDIRYVMSHVEVAKYVARERPDLSKEWIQLLVFMQGMDPQKRVTSTHVEEENEQWVPPYYLEFQMAHIHSLFVTGASMVHDVKLGENKTLKSEQEDSEDDGDVIRHAKVGRLSEESSVVRMVGRSNGSDLEMWETCQGSTSSSQATAMQTCNEDIDSAVCSVPVGLAWLINECTKSLDNWLGNDTAKHLRNSPSIQIESSTRKPVQWRGRGGRGLIRDAHSSASFEPMNTDNSRGGILRGLRHYGRRIALRSEPQDDEGHIGRTISTENNSSNISEMDVDMVNNEDSLGWACINQEVEGLSVLRLEEWPTISYDVSRQEVSFHIPLHRLLSLSLHKAMEMYDAELGQTESKGGDLNLSLSGSHCDFFKQLLGGCHPSGFSAFVMEHILRLKVFCAQVRAGMWRRNGHSTLSLFEFYHSVRWSEDSLELDLFLLQCCAAMAPPEAFVLRVLERFGLSDYLSLNLVRPNEYEPTLTLKMLALIIRVVTERGYCGLSAKESLKRELIRKLAVGDATRSQLLKALPPRLSDKKDLQEILDTVASYSHPSGMQQGKYSLRKDYWQELDLYHPGWSSRDLQIAEERYARFCKASAVVNQLPCWKKPFRPLYNLSKIATSKGVLQIVRSVVFYAVFSESSSESRAPDGVLFMALHLLALGLDICSSNKTQTHHMTNNDMLVHISQISTMPEENETISMDIATSCDEQESSPLLAYATEVINIGSIERLDISNHQSLLSLLVLLLQKYENGCQQGIALESSHCNIAVLIRSLLQKFAELNCGCMREIEKLLPSVVHHLSVQSDKCSGVKDAVEPVMPAYLSDVERKRAIARERQAAIMAKMKTAQASFVASLGSKETVESKDSEQGKLSLEDDEDLEGTELLVCSLCRELGCKSPTAFLTLVQRSRLLSFAEKGPPSWENTHLNGDDLKTSGREGASESALESGILEAEADWQWIDNFLDANHNGPLEAEGLLEFLRVHLPNVTNAIVSDDSDANMQGSADIREDESVIVDDSDSCKEAASDLVLNGLSESLALIRKGMAAGSKDAETDVLAEYVAAIYNEMSKQQKDTENQSEFSSTESLALISQPSIFDGFGPRGCDGIHVSSCGHAVHQECLDRYLSSLRQRYNSRIIFEGVQIVDPSQGEFLCPVCRRLANSVLPVLRESPCAAMSGIPSRFSSGESSRSSASSQSIQLHQALTLLRNAEVLASKQGFHKAASRHQQNRIVEIESLSHKLYALYCPGKSISKPTSERINQSLLLWDVFRYSLLAAELAARSSRLDTITRSSGSSLEALHRVVNCSRGSVLSLLLQVAKATQSQNRLTVLLRSRGMQLLVGSISCGVSRDTVSTNSLTGNILSLLEHINKGKDFPDIQFWKRMADPVLIHDPFSSLIWMLFCLPTTLQIENELFISLVHLFYLVCLVQAIVYAGTFNFSDCDSKFDSHSFIKSISSELSGTTLSQLYSETAEADLFSFSRELLIRRLTLPYLRRCALLFTLLCSSSALLIETGGFEEMAGHRSDDHMENKDEILKELEELQHLENLFHIPILETILDDKSVHDLALKWCQHLFKETRARSYKHVVRSLPACPFELMRLPYLYQDLLQRYIKECCSRCKTVPDQPALCLLCGTLCCAPSRRACCKKNECLRHAFTCGAGIGVFLMIRKTNILLQRSARQASWPSPYLDAFGEEDYDMQRGKPLYLSKERYAALTQMVVSHGLDHTHFSEVLSVDI
ncbi:hypothetical protein SUGI_0851350 [Cryptomeria japonica]|nr:hypothetical protein SUGI_0851350 [Cryptomeria japonica]